MRKWVGTRTTHTEQENYKQTVLLRADVRVYACTSSPRSPKPRHPRSMPSSEATMMSPRRGSLSCKSSMLLTCVYEG